MNLPASLAAEADTILNRHRELFIGLRSARVLLTGGTGFVGRWLVLALLHANERLDLGCSVVLLSRDPVRSRRSTPWLDHSRISWVQGDIRQLASDALPTCSHLIHAAGEVGTAGQLRGLDTAMNGTLALMRTSAATSAERFLHISSGAVYATSSDLPVREDAAIAPELLDARFSYHHGKRAAEVLCVAGRAEGVIRHLTIARLFSAIGPYLPAGQGFAAADLVADAVAGRPLRIQGDGTARRSYLYAADLVGWLYTLLLRGDDGAAYNVGSPDVLSIAELATAISRIHPAHPRVEILGQKMDGRAGSAYFPDVTKAQDQFGLRAWTSIDSAIDRTLSCQGDLS